MLLPHLTRPRGLLTLVAFGLAFVASHAYAQAPSVTVRMSASPLNVRSGEVVQLLVQVDAVNTSVDSITEPRLEGFEVVGRQISRPMQFSLSFGNGRAQNMARATTVIEYTLVAGAPGRYTIPAVAAVAGRARFNAPRGVTITVAKNEDSVGQQPGSTIVQPENPGASAAPPDGPLDGAVFDEQVFLRTVVDKESAYVGEQVTVTVYLYASGSLAADPVVQSEPNAVGFWVHDLLTDAVRQQRTNQNVGGRRFHVYVLRRFAAIPQRAGPLTITPMALTLSVSRTFDLFDFRTPESLQRQSVPRTIQVRARPSAVPESAVTGTYSIDATLDRRQVATGDAVVLRATVRGTGNISQVQLATPQVAGLRFLDPQIRETVEAPNDVLGGARVYEWLVIPERAGRYEIPPFALTAFDPATGTANEVRSSAFELVAAGNGGVTPEEEPQARTPASTPSPGEAPLGTVHSTASLERSAPSIHGARWYPFALAFPVAAWLLLGLGRMLRDRAARRHRANAPARAWSDAMRRIEHAPREADARSGFAAIGGAVQAGLGMRLGQSVGSLTYPDLARLLADRGAAPELPKRIVELLEECDVARFAAPRDANAVADAATRARDLMREIERTAWRST